MLTAERDVLWISFFGRLDRLTRTFILMSFDMTLSVAKGCFCCGMPNSNGKIYS